MRPERVCLVGALHPVHGLAHQRLVARLGLGAADLDLHRIVLVALGDRVDAMRQRRREEHGLAVVGRALEDRLDVVGEAHVEHLVGLVENHGADAVELERTAPDVVDRPAGRGDDDVDATVEHLQLALDRLAAEHRDHLDAELLAVLEHRLAHLDGELTGRHEDQDRRLGALGGVDAVQRRQCEGCGLARTRGGLTEEVMAGEQVRDGLALDRRGLFVAEVGDRLEQLRTQPERGEPVVDGLGIDRRIVDEHIVDQHTFDQRLLVRSAFDRLDIRVGLDRFVRVGLERVGGALIADVVDGQGGVGQRRRLRRRRGMGECVKRVVHGRAFSGKQTTIRLDASPACLTRKMPLARRVSRRRPG